MPQLAIETSCDDTCAAVLDGGAVLSSIVSSQEAHSKFGGVVPEVASRHHLELITPVIEKSLADAGLGLGDIDSVAVTAGPGLIGALLVGLLEAFSSYWSSGFKEVIVFTLIIPVLLWRSLTTHQHEEDE